VQMAAVRAAEEKRQLRKLQMQGEEGTKAEGESGTEEGPGPEDPGAADEHGIEFAGDRFMPTGSTGAEVREDWDKHAVIVRVLSARGLPAMDRNGKADPFVVLKCDGEELKTTVVKGSLEPEWTDRPFLFHDVSSSAMLTAEVYDWNRAARADPIGQATIRVDAMSGKTESFVLQPLRGSAPAGALTMECTSHAHDSEALAAGARICIMIRIGAVTETPIRFHSFHLLFLYCVPQDKPPRKKRRRRGKRPARRCSSAIKSR
jgi:hypothetical protein